MKERNNILLYAKEANSLEERLLKKVEEVVPPRSLEVVRTVESLSRRLTMQAYSRAIVILLVANRADLMDVAAIQHLLYDVRSILILSDRETDAVTIAHGLRPRFVSYHDSDFSDVGAVLGKMVERYKTGEKAKNARRLML
jgi:hypothetical protein